MTARKSGCGLRVSGNGAAHCYPTILLFDDRGSKIEVLARRLLAAMVGDLDTQGDTTMLRLAILFLVIALIAAALGFGGVASVGMEGARIFFLIFLILAVLFFVGNF